MTVTLPSSSGQSASGVQSNARPHNGQAASGDTGISNLQPRDLDALPLTDSLQLSYQTQLGRNPSAEDIRHYQQEQAKGRKNSNIHDEIRNSPEAQQHGRQTLNLDALPLDYTLNLGYQQFLGRQFTQADKAHYAQEQAKGRTNTSIFGEIATSGEAVKHGAGLVDPYYARA